MNTFSHCQYYTINGKNLNINRKRLHPFLDFAQKSQMRLRRMKAQESLNQTSSPEIISTLTSLHPRSRIPASFQKFQISIFIGKMEIGDRIFYINEFLIQICLADCSCRGQQENILIRGRSSAVQTVQEDHTTDDAVWRLQRLICSTENLFLRGCHITRV